MYLSSIQQGIQAGHVIAEMSLKYAACASTNGPGPFNEWAEKHKTMVLLNAGYGEEIHDLVRFFDRQGHCHHQYPWASFNEGQDALDGALTCVGIILPEKIYDLAKLARDPDEFKIIEHSVTSSGEYVDPNFDVKWEYNKWEWDLVKRLNQYGLAR